MERTSLLCRVFFLLLIVLMLQGCSTFGARSGHSQSRDEVVMSALSQVGAPYRFGGSSPSQGFDCSGLVQYTHSLAGIRVPRTARDQHKAAGNVSRSRLLPGDLVFFKTGWRQYHVGIMVDQNRFVHAPSSSKAVQIAHLEQPYWRKRFSGAGSFFN